MFINWNYYTSDVVLPSATYSTSCNTNTVTLTATPTSTYQCFLDRANYTYKYTCWKSATSTATGVFTLTVTDPSNGCVQTYTLLTSLPPLNIVSSPTTNL